MISHGRVDQRQRTMNQALVKNQAPVSIVLAGHLCKPLQGQMESPKSHHHPPADRKIAKGNETRTIRSSIHPSKLNPHLTRSEPPRYDQIPLNLPHSLVCARQNSLDQTDDEEHHLYQHPPDANHQNHQQKREARNQETHKPNPPTQSISSTHYSSNFHSYHPVPNPKTPPQETATQTSTNSSMTACEPARAPSYKSSTRCAAPV